MNLIFLHFSMLMWFRWRCCVVLPDDYFCFCEYDWICLNAASHDPVSLIQDLTQYIKPHLND